MFLLDIVMDVLIFYGVGLFCDGLIRFVFLVCSYIMIRVVVVVIRELFV